jgi:AAA domain-containing protein
MTPALEAAIASCDPRHSGGQIQARCPAHDDRVRSLAVRDFGDKTGLYCHAGCDTPAIVEALGINMTDLFDEPMTTERREVAYYDYLNTDGNVVFQVIRYEPKGFGQRRPDGNGGWIYNLEGVDRVPYHLPELVRATGVIIVEGEKDADRLAGYGLFATCNPGGAGPGKWRPEWGPLFDGKTVVIVPDNDEPGRKHAATIRDSLLDHARRVRIVELPDVRPKGDVSDYLDLHSIDELRALLQPPVAPTIDEFIGAVRGSETADLYTDIIPAGGLVIFAGQPRSFKTMAALQMMFSVASGNRWLDHTPARTGDCLYVSEEGARDKIADRLEAMRRAYNPTHSIHVLHREGITLTGQGWEKVRATLEDMDQPTVVILDTLAALMEGDENSVADVRDALRPIQKIITDFGVTVALVHHINKGGEGRIGNRLRGSSALWGASDGTLGFVRDEDANGVAQDTGEVRVETKDNDPQRIRFGFQFETMTLKADVRPALTVASLVEEVARRQAERQQPVPIEEVRTYFSVGKSWFYERVKEAAEHGLEQVSRGLYRVRPGFAQMGIDNT